MPTFLAAGASSISASGDSAAAMRPSRAGPTSVGLLAFLSRDLKAIRRGAQRAACSEQLLALGQLLSANGEAEHR